MIPNEVIESIKKQVGAENCSSAQAELYTYGSDASIHQALPELVVRPRKIEDVQYVVKLANEYNIPVIARGSGSGLCGNAVPINGGIVLDMKLMNRIIEINIRDQYVIVEPGVINDELNRRLNPYGYFFPPTPASGKVATIGGMIGNNASGMRAGKYGATRDAVLGLKVVVGTGELIEVGSINMKFATGYHLEKLFVGSEGTLGIVVEAILKIVPLPEARAICIAAFGEIADAGKTVGKIMESGLNPSALEIIDAVCIRAVNKATDAGLPECDAVLLVEVDGAPESVKRQLPRVEKLCYEGGAISVKSAVESKEMIKLWTGRSAVLPALSRLEGGLVSMSLADDMNVPLSKVPDVIKAFQKAAEKYDVVIGTYGHAGTGNLHTKVLFDPRTPEAWKRAQQAIDEVYDAVLRAGGTCSGEHGIAISKAPYMKRERATTLKYMRELKKLFDPNNILNPGKIMDAPDDFLTATKLRYPVTF